MSNCSSFLGKFSVSKEGYLSIVIAAVLTLLFFTFNSVLGVIGLFCTVVIIYFFRDPQRAIPINDQVVLCPADGVILNIERTMPPVSLGLEEEMYKVSIFLSPLNVHVNRLPVDGIVKKLHYTPGKHMRADYDTEENERQDILIESNNKKNIVVVQQTGFLARRIVCDLNQNDEVKAGMRFGIIKFGSRVNLYLPLDANVCVFKKQTVIAGETIIASFSDAIPLIKDHIFD